MYLPVSVPRTTRCAQGILNSNARKLEYHHISHYRNHGTDYGRVLAGFDIKEEELKR